METHRTDLAIMGAGAAGLAAAIAAQRKVEKILIICKGNPFASGSSFANINKRWGITWAAHEREQEYLEKRINTISKGTNMPGLTKLLVSESCSAFETLKKWSVQFVTDSTQTIERFTPCFCPFPLAAIIKSCHQFAQCVKKQLDFTRVSLLPNTCIKEILLDHGRLCGLVAENAGNEFIIKTKAGILATGGNASLYPYHITEPGLTGDGYRLLEKTGIELANMEYMQLVWEDVDPEAKRFPVARLWDQNYRFKTVSGKNISLTMVKKDLLKARKTHVPISNLQKDREIDAVLMRHCQDGTPLLVVNKQTGRVENKILPHAQACNGGVIIGVNGETSIPGLFAAGEVTTGMHGGDRVGGMMITSCLVFGRRAGLAAAQMV